MNDSRAPTRDLPILLISLGLQLVLALFFGHVYDMRIFMAAGHQVGTGQNPYTPQDLSFVFHDPGFQNITTVGYPPPWPLLLGAIYRVVYATIPSFLVYNAAIKLPLILANIALAYLVAACLRRLAVDEARAHRAWIFVLLNPFLLYATAAWGQIDSIVALFSLLSLMQLTDGRRDRSAILLAVAVAFKPTAVPLVLAALVFPTLGPLRFAIRYLAVFLVSLSMLCVAPFLLLGWDPAPILRGWNAHMVVGGGMSFMTFLELLRNSYALPGLWWLIGLLWVPALAATAILAKAGGRGLIDLLKYGTALVMVFFLTRAWLSEPNIVLVLPLILILVAAGELDGRLLTAVWILPVVFGIANASSAQLFFPSMPHIMEDLLGTLEQVRTARLAAKVLVVVPWQIVGWTIVVRCLRHPSSGSADIAI